MNRFCTSSLERVARMSPRASILIGAALLAGTGALDWATGPQIVVSVVYLVPIAWMTWKTGRWGGLSMALASGAVWLTLELKTHPPYSSLLIPVWNSFVRTTMFCLISGLLTEVIERKRVEKRLRQTNDDLQNQTGILQSILNSMGDGVVVADSQGRLIHINPAGKRMVRIPPGDANIVAWLEAQHHQLSQSGIGDSTDRNPLLRALRGQTMDAVEMFLRHENLPEGIWLSVTSRPLAGHAGRLSGGVIVFNDITARKGLERQIAEVSDREQRRIGEDLHDGLCQHLVSTAFAARKLASRLSDQSLPETEDAAEIAELLSQAVSQARAVARGLYLVPLEAGGLSSALEELAMQVRSRHRIACQLVDKTTLPILDQTLVTNLFRIAQEAVNNAAKHSNPSQITVTLATDAQSARLMIEDDGAGFQPEAAPAGGMGLHLMRYRARMIGAALDIASRPGSGTVVTCSVLHPKVIPLTTHAQPP